MNEPKTAERKAYERSVEDRESPEVQEHKRRLAILSEQPKDAEPTH
jgi:hypothetical protein